MRQHGHYASMGQQEVDVVEQELFFKEILEKENTYPINSTSHVRLMKAKYEALILGLLAKQAKGISRLKIMGDSKLIIL